MNCINVYKNLDRLNAGKPRAKELGNNKYYVLYEKDTKVCNIAVEEKFSVKTLYDFLYRRSNDDDYGICGMGSCILDVIENSDYSGNLDDLVITFYCIPYVYELLDIAFVKIQIDGHNNIIYHGFDELESKYDDIWLRDWNAANITFSDPMAQQIFDDSLPYMRGNMGYPYTDPYTIISRFEGPIADSLADIKASYEAGPQ